MRRLRNAAAGAVLLLLTVTALQPGEVVSQEASATVVETGWWSQQPTGTPGAAFEVARGPNGDLSWAAFRIQVNGALTTASLQLSQLQAAGAPSLQVCVTTSPWTVAAPGGWDARPTPSCGAQPTRLVRNDVANTWVADIPSFLPAGQPTASVMVIPAPDEAITVPPPVPPPPVGVPVAPPATLPPPQTIPAQPPVPLPFSISFSGAQIFASGSAAVAPTADTPVAPAFEPSGGLGATGDDTFFAPEVPALNEQAAIAPAQVPGRFPQRGDVGTPGGGGTDKPWERVPLFAIAAAAIGAASVFGRQRLRDLGWLGAT